MTKQLILANANVVLENEVIRGAVTVIKGVITAIDPGMAIPSGAEDMEGDLLCPGLSELHTDDLDRHVQPRPKVDWPPAAALLPHAAGLAGAGSST